MMSCLVARAARLGGARFGGRPPYDPLEDFGIKPRRVVGVDWHIWTQPCGRSSSAEPAIAPTEQVPFPLHSSDTGRPGTFGVPQEIVT